MSCFFFLLFILYCLMQCCNCISSTKSTRSILVSVSGFKDEIAESFHQKEKYFYPCHDSLWDKIGWYFSRSSICVTNSDVTTRCLWWKFKCASISRRITNVCRKNGRRPWELQQITLDSLGSANICTNGLGDLHQMISARSRAIPANRTQYVYYRDITAFWISHPDKAIRSDGSRSLTPSLSLRPYSFLVFF